MVTDNFILTGFGRSGTKFIQTILNTSKLWQVEHEPRGNDYKINKTDGNYIRKIEKDFEKEHYGEVNSYLRFYYKELSIKSALLLRNPKNIFLSVVNRKGMNQWCTYYEEIIVTYRNFFKEIEENNKKYFVFENYTKSKEEFEPILKFLGIDDINLNDIDFNKKINTNKQKKYNNLQDLREITNLDFSHLEKLEQRYLEFIIN